MCKMHHKNSIRLQLLGCLAILLYLCFKQCAAPNSSTPFITQNIIQTDTATIVRIDTVYPEPKIVYLPAQAPPEPQLVTLAESKQLFTDFSPQVNTVLDTVFVRDSIQELVHDTSYLLGDRGDVALNYYEDSLQDDEVTIYYKNLVHGELLHQELSYKLRAPTIIKTIDRTITNTIQRPSLFLTTAVRVDQQWRDLPTLALGVTYANAKFSVGYDYDFMQGVHSVGVGINLLGLKNR